MRRAIVLLALTTACYEPPDYRQTHFACKRSSLCPDGLVCSEDHCVDPSQVDALTLIEHAAPFLIMRDEVTEADYARCAAAGSCPGPARIDAPDAPILGLSEGAASAFCRSMQMRLPTDDEWAAAERAGVIRGDGVRCARSVN